MREVEQYRGELERAVEDIRTVASSVAIRGEGAAQFVFATAGQRSLELSRSSEAEFWIEYWSDADGDPARSDTYPSLAEAIAAARAWLADLE